MSREIYYNDYYFVDKATTPHNLMELSSDVYYAAKDSFNSDYYYDDANYHEFSGHYYE